MSSKSDCDKSSSSSNIGNEMETNNKGDQFIILFYQLAVVIICLFVYIVPEILVKKVF